MVDDSAPAQASKQARRPSRLGKSMMPLFVGLAAALMALGLVIGQTVVAQREARVRATFEGDVLLALNEVMAATLDGETGQRGYLLTGKREYLQPYRPARDRTERAMARLREMSAAAPDRQFAAQIDRLDALTRAKFDEMSRSVALAQAGFKDQAMALLQADFGQLQMDAIRAEVAALIVERANRRRDAFLRAAVLEIRLLPLVVGLSVAILALVYAGFRAERSRSLTEAEAEQAAALREANERAELLARELNHRVKNLFSVVLSIVALSGRKQTSKQEVVEDIGARIRALSLAHGASQGSSGTDMVELGALISRTMEPYADESGRRVTIGGAAVTLPVRMVTPIGLIIHELATNAVKYGALSVEGGTVAVNWAVETDGGAAHLALSWVEVGGPPVDAAACARGDGFGSRMTTLAAGQLGGAIEREWPAAGAVARLRFPLP
jgi:two-component sensor histidine kinase/CHASE3 domain sensor protein